jgi:hypothetical protein
MFQRYKRCPWEIEAKPEDDEDGTRLCDLSLPLLSVHCLDSPPRMRFYDAVSFWWLLATYQLTYLQPEAIGHFLSPREEPSSMLLDRGDEEDGLTLSNSTSRPFMSMFICGLFVY